MMRRGRRILAVAGMTALLLSNIGTATRTVFAEEQTGMTDPVTATDETAVLQTQEAVEPEVPAADDTGAGETTAGDTQGGDTGIATQTVTEAATGEPVADEPTGDAGGTDADQTPNQTDETGTEAVTTDAVETPGEGSPDDATDPADAEAADVNADASADGTDAGVDETPDADPDAEEIDTDADAETDPDEEESEDDLVLIEQTIKATADDGASVEIAGNLPEDAQARMEPVTLERDELDSYFGSDVVSGMDRLAIYDISIYVNDEEWEPNETVSVKVHNPDIQPIDGNAESEAATDTENIVVAHLEDGGEQIATYSDENVAEFEIEGVPAEDQDDSDADAADSKEDDTARPAEENASTERAEEPATDAAEHESNKTSDHAEAAEQDASSEITGEAEPAEDAIAAGDGASTEQAAEDTAEAGESETTETSESTHTEAMDAEPAGEITAEVLPSDSSDGEVSFETDGFSLYGFYTYTVDFYYENSESRFPGGSTFRLSQLLDELGIANTAEDVTDVTCSNETLITATQEDDDWSLTSLLPFTTSETLTVTFEDGSEIVIRAMDDQESTASYENLPWKVENGSFETRKYEKDWTYDNATAVPWSTTSDGIETAEYSQMGGKYNKSGVDKPTYMKGIDVGNIYAELNANTAGTMYQDIQTAEGATLTWGLYHRARTSNSSTATDEMYVVVMSIEDADSIMNYTRGTKETDHDVIKKVATGILGNEGHDSGNYTVTITKNGTTQSVEVRAEVWKISTTTTDSSDWYGNYSYSCTAGETWGNETGAEVYSSSVSGWSYKTAQYTVPSGQTGTRLLFVSGTTGTGNETMGNMIDVVSFSQKLDYTIEYRVWDETQNEYVIQTADTETGSSVAGNTVTASKTSNYSTYQYLGAYAGSASGGDSLPSDLTYETSFQLLNGKNYITLYYGMPLVKTGVETGRIPLAIFPLGIAFLALYGRTRRRFTH